MPATIPSNTSQAQQLGAALTQLYGAGPYSAAQKRNALPLALRIAQGINASNDAARNQQRAAAIKATQIQTVTNVTDTRAINAATRTATLIANAEKAAVAFAGAHGNNILLPNVQAAYNTQQQHYQALITAGGGVYDIPPLAAISPVVQNNQLALAGVGLTNAANAAQLNAQVAGFNTATAALAAAQAANAAALQQAAINQAIAETTPTAAYLAPGAPSPLVGTSTTPATIVQAAGTPSVGTSGATGGSTVSGGGGAPIVGTSGATAGTTSGTGSLIAGLSTTEILIGAGAILAGLWLALKGSGGGKNESGGGHRK